MPNNFGMPESTLTTHRLKYVAFLRPCDTPHFLANFKYSFKKIWFEQRFRARRNNALFVNWHFVDILGILTCSKVELFLQVPSWQPAYEEVVHSLRVQQLFSHTFAPCCLLKCGVLSWYAFLSLSTTYTIFCCSPHLPYLAAVFIICPL